MIYVTGDTHNMYEEFIDRLSKVPLRDGDTIIITGDFCFIGNDRYHKHIPDIALLPYNICFIDGNHENFDLLCEYPVEEWNGGRVHRVADNIYHLMRGQIFTIENKTFFTFGGAFSIDWEQRTKGYDWWPQELPTNEDYDTARSNLEKNGYSVDYVVTHNVPLSVIHRMGRCPSPQEAELTGYFEWLSGNLSFKRWFAGHYHVTEQYNNIDILFSNIIQIK